MAGSPPVSTKPLVLYLNHASWWDPLVCLALKEQFFPERKAFAPIDAAALKHYRFFRTLGFFGVQRGEWGGAAEFLRVSQEVLRQPGSMLVITPQGRFADVRERPVQFLPGLGHLAARLEDAVFVPLAVEYVFWEERLPEILTRFGDPLYAGRHESGFVDSGQWTAMLQVRLTATQDELARESLLRRAESFRTLFRGGAGQGGVYDWWGRVRAGLSGETFIREHGKK
jgi:1-acyl-sn-glycerol-3-phosphate acyltransferase